MIANSRRRAFACAGALVCLMALTRAARAGDAAGAEVLFTEGKRLAEEGNYPAACPKFEESQKLDPGIGTLYRLADCYEHVGRTASAWAAFVEVASAAKSSGQQARAEDAKKRASELEPSLAKLVVRVQAPDTPGLVVKRGEVVVGRAQWNVPMPVDPGPVPVEAAAPGHKTWHGTVEVGARATAQLDVPSLEKEAAVAPATIPASGERPADTGWGTHKTLALAAGAAGVVGFGVGTIFGLISASKGSAADKHCDEQNFCDDAEGLSLKQDAITAGNVATVGFVAGGVLAATGVVLWLTVPDGRATGRAAPRFGVAPRWAGATFHMELP